MNTRTRRLQLLNTILALAATAGLGGCELENVDSVTRNTFLNVQGFYSNPSGRVVAQNSGAAIRTLDLRQSGDKLEAIDNNNRVFRGTLGLESGSSSSFALNGSTTAGAEGTITGTISVSGNQATMSGTWIEAALYSTVLGTAQVVPTPTNAPPPSTNTNTTASLRLRPASRESWMAYRHAALWFLDDA